METSLPNSTRACTGPSATKIFYSDTHKGNPTPTPPELSMQKGTVSKKIYLFI
jgi:hypothetical protein